MSDLEGALPGSALLIRGWQIKNLKNQQMLPGAGVGGGQKVGPKKNRSKVKVLVFVEVGRPSTGCDVFSCKSSKGKFVNQLTPDDDKILRI